MNRERLRELADHIEAQEHLHFTDDEITNGFTAELPEFFNMKTVCSDTKCGTVGCIAAHACLLFGDQGKGTSMRKAGRLLGLGVDEGDYRIALFTPGSEGEGMEDITPQQAARACRRLADGEADGLETVSLIEDALWADDDPGEVA